MDLSKRRDRDMNTRIRTAMAAAAACLFVAAAGCTDTLVEPKSTVTEANIFTDPTSYQKFTAKLYAGLAVTGQVGPNGNADIVSNDEGFMSYTRLLWNLNELPTDETALAWGDLAIQELNQDIWATTNDFIKAMYYRIYYQVVLANEFFAPDNGRETGLAGTYLGLPQDRGRGIPGRGAVPAGPQLLACHRLLR
jgi:hypothetical protein